MGSRNAEAELGSMYLFGLGVVRDAERGLEMVRKSARAGNHIGLLRLGFIYLNGDYLIEQDASRAVHHFRRAKGLYNGNALLEFGRLYKKGRGVRRKTWKATSYFQRAANANNTRGVVASAICFRDGIGTEKNNKIAPELLERASNMGNSSAKVYLGLCFRREEGVETCITASMKLFCEAPASVEAS